MIDYTFIRIRLKIKHVCFNWTLTAFHRREKFSCLNILLGERLWGSIDLRSTCKVKEFIVCEEEYNNYNYLVYLSKAYYCNSRCE